MAPDGIYFMPAAKTQEIEKMTGIVKDGYPGREIPGIILHTQFIKVRMKIAFGRLGKDD